MCHRQRPRRRLDRRTPTALVHGRGHHLRRSRRGPRWGAGRRGFRQPRRCGGASALGPEQPGRLVAVERVLVVIGRPCVARWVGWAVLDPQRHAGAGLLGARPAAARRRRLDGRGQLARVARRGGVEERDLLLRQLGLTGLLLVEPVHHFERARHPGAVLIRHREVLGGVDPDHGGLGAVELGARLRHGRVLAGHPLDLGRRVDDLGQLGRRIADRDVERVAQRAQLGAQLSGGRTVARRGRQRRHDQLVDVVAEPGVDLARSPDLGVAHRAQRLEVAEPGEQPPVGHQLPQQHADREHVAAWIEVFVARLLRRDIGELAAHRAVPGRLVLGALGDAEIGELDLAGARYQHVRGRHVAVNQRHRLAVRRARRVRVLERLADLGADVEREVERDPAAPALDAALDPAKILAVDVLHHQEVLAIVAQAHVEDLHDVAVLEQREHLGLGDQQLDEALVLREVRQDPLDRHGLLEAAGRDGFAAKDLGHSADADAVEQLVPSHEVRA